jgi:hypothetical protein
MLNAVLMTLLIALAAGGVMMAVTLVWLVRAHLKLKHDHQALAAIVQGHNHDIADLCAATLSVDGQIAATDEQLSALYAKMADYRHDSPSVHPYSQAIQKVQGGASVNELMKNAGLSQDEAALLIRLHGPKAR